MQSRYTPTYAQISKKTRLTGEDCGRAILMCTADSALNEGIPSPLPENVADFINTVLPFNLSEASVYGTYLKLCNYLSHQRALADAHALRSFAHMTSMLKSLETSFAVEQALTYLSGENSAVVENAYSTHAPFVGYGIESFIPALYSGSADIIEGARIDSANFQVSLKVVTAFNLSIRLISEETRVHLDSLLIDTSSLDEKANAFNVSSRILRDFISNSNTPLKAEKLSVLDKFFGEMPSASEITLPNHVVSRARDALKDLQIFESGEITLADILMEEIENAG